MTSPFFHGPNTHGRDFVVGDIHGMLSLLTQLLQDVRFDASTDRLFSTGDLVDRGEDSRGALMLLKEPWFFPVRGNHEDMLLDYLVPTQNSRYRRGHDHAFFANGGEDWFYPEGVNPELVFLLQKMPFIRVVAPGTPYRFNVVHASFVKQATKTGDIAVWTDAEIDAGIPDGPERFIEGYDECGPPTMGFLWDRTLPYAAMRVRQALSVIGVELLSPTYCGHTPVNTPRCIGGHTFIDTGAFQEYDEDSGLTIVELNTPASAIRRGTRPHFWTRGLVDLTPREGTL